MAKTVAIGSDPAAPEDVTYFIDDGERGERGNAGDHLALVFDGHGDLTNRYLHGPAIDQILADEQVDSLTAPGEVLWLLTDNLGTVRDLAAYDDTTDYYEAWLRQFLELPNGIPSRDTLRRTVSRLDPDQFRNSWNFCT